MNGLVKKHQNVDKKQELRHGGAFYSVSSWGVCWNDEWYYLIAFDDKAQEIRHYRLDKMKKISLTNEKRVGRDSFHSLDMEIWRCILKKGSICLMERRKKSILSV